MKSRSASGGISREPSPEIDSRLEALVLRYGPFMRDVVARLCPRNLGLDRREIEQTALIRLWRALESEREIRNLESYMYRIMGRVTLDAIREVKARREDPVVTRQLEAIMASPATPASGTEPPETLFFQSSPTFDRKKMEVARMDVAGAEWTLGVSELPGAPRTP